MKLVHVVTCIIVAGCGADSPQTPVSEPRLPFHFDDSTASSGLSFVHDAGITETKHLPETMGAGAAVGDFNEDGHLDFYLVQSGPLPLGDSEVKPRTNELWLGDGKGHFSNHTAQSGAAAHTGYGMGVAMADYNGDGHLDLYVTNLGADVLLMGNGQGSFIDSTDQARLGDTRWTAGATFFDGDNDGDLDLYVTAYVDYDLSKPVYCGDKKPGWRSYCHPDQYQGLGDVYWKNLGNGTFIDDTHAAGLANNRGKGLGAMASDVDNDGDMDLYVANDSVENRLWLGDGKGHFEDGTLFSGTGVNGSGLTEAGMGIAMADLNENGLCDVYVTNFDDESNTLYTNDGDGLFTDSTARAGLDAASRLPVGFGTVAADFDDDGDLDLAVVNGHIIDNIHLYNDSKSWAQEALLFENKGAARFRNVSSESGDFAANARVGRGLYTGDFDEDGDLDLLQTENNGPARIFLKHGQSPAAFFLEGLPPGTQVWFMRGTGPAALRLAGPQISYFGACAPSVRFPDTTSITGLRIRRPGDPEAMDLAGPIEPGRFRLVLQANQPLLIRR